MGFWAELRRRSVFRVAGVYVVVGWLVAQAAVVLESGLGLPDLFSRIAIAALILGFPVALVIAWAFELTPEGVRRTPSAAEGRAARPLAVTDMVIAVALVGVLGFAAYDAVRGRAAPATVAEAAPAAPAPDDLGPSVAVLPFADMSPQGDQEYFADGLSEELMNQLAQVEGLLVTGRTSAFVYKNHNEDLRTIGETLGVKSILEGSVRKAGDRLRITAQLVNAADGYHLWSESYDRDFGDVFQIQEDIAGAVTAALSAELGVAAENPFEAQTDDPAAYDLYLRATEQFREGDADNLLRAEELYREAIARDPNFLGAQIGLFDALGVSIGFFPDRIDEIRAEQDAIVARAIAQQSEAWAGYLLRAIRLTLEGDLLAARRALDIGYENAPGSQRAVLEANLTTLRRIAGRWSGTLEQARAEARADPLSLFPSFRLQRTLHALGRLDEAEAEYRRSLDLQGNRLLVEAWALQRAVVEGFGEDVIAERRERLGASWPPDLPSPAAQLDPVALLDDPETALAGMRRELARASEPGSLDPIAIAMWADHFGDAELALEALRAAYERQGAVATLPWDGVYRHVRSAPGFKDLMRDYGYVDYWRETGEWSDFCRPLESEDGGDDDFECF